MKKYLLDTNICIYLFKNQYQIAQKIALAGVENCFLSEITLAELHFGVANSPGHYQTHNQQQLEQLEALFKERILPISSCFTIYAQQKTTLKKRGQLIGEFDLLIGCTALAYNLIMVTQNTREFQRLEGLVVENWTEE